MAGFGSSDELINSLNMTQPVLSAPNYGTTARHPTSPPDNDIDGTESNASNVSNMYIADSSMNSSFGFPEYEAPFILVDPLDVNVTEHSDDFINSLSMTQPVNFAPNSGTTTRYPTSLPDSDIDDTETDDSSISDLYTADSNMYLGSPAYETSFYLDRLSEIKDKAIDNAGEAQDMKQEEISLSNNNEAPTHHTALQNYDIHDVETSDSSPSKGHSAQQCLNYTCPNIKCAEKRAVGELAVEQLIKTDSNMPPSNKLKENAQENLAEVPNSKSVSTAANHDLIWSPSTAIKMRSKFTLVHRQRDNRSETKDRTLDDTGEEQDIKQGEIFSKNNEAPRHRTALPNYDINDVVISDRALSKEHSTHQCLNSRCPNIRRIFLSAEPELQHINAISNIPSNECKENAQDNLAEVPNSKSTSTAAIHDLIWSPSTGIKMRSKFGLVNRQRDNRNEVKEITTDNTRKVQDMKKGEISFSNRNEAPRRQTTLRNYNIHDVETRDNLSGGNSSHKCLTSTCPNMECMDRRSQISAKRLRELLKKICPNEYTENEKEEWSEMPNFKNMNTVPRHDSIWSPAGIITERSKNGFGKFHSTCRSEIKHLPTDNARNVQDMKQEGVSFSSNNEALRLSSLSRALPNYDINDVVTSDDGLSKGHSTNQCLNSKCRNSKCIDRFTRSTVQRVLAVLNMLPPNECKENAQENLSEVPNSKSMSTAVSHDLNLSPSALITTPSKNGLINHQISNRSETKDMTLDNTGEEQDIKEGEISFLNNNEAPESRTTLPNYDINDVVSSDDGLTKGHSTNQCLNSKCRNSKCTDRFTQLAVQHMAAALNMRSSKECKENSQENLSEVPNSKSMSTAASHDLNLSPFALITTPSKNGLVNHQISNRSGLTDMSLENTSKAQEMKHVETSNDEPNSGMTLPNYDTKGVVTSDKSLSEGHPVYDRLMRQHCLIRRSRAFMNELSSNEGRENPQEKWSEVPNPMNIDTDASNDLVLSPSSIETTPSRSGFENLDSVKRTDIATTKDDQLFQRQKRYPVSEIFSFPPTFLLIALMICIYTVCKVLSLPFKSTNTKK